MANFGLSEMLFIGILVVVFVGPKDLPKLLKLLGRGYGKIRRASEELRRTFTMEVDRVEAEGRAEQIRQRREELLERRRSNLAKAQRDGEGIAHSDEVPTDEDSESEEDEVTSPGDPSDEPVDDPPQEIPVIVDVPDADPGDDD